MTQENIPSHEDDLKEFINLFRDFDPFDTNPVLNICKQTITKKIREQINPFLSHLIEKMEHNYDELKESTDPTVYTGMAGISLMFLHLHKTLRRKEALDRAKDATYAALKCLNGDNCSFLNGNSGPLVSACILHHILGQRNEVLFYANWLEKLKGKALKNDFMKSDNILNGKGGYLYALLYVNKVIGENIIKRSTIISVIKSIIKNGRREASSRNLSCPLMWMSEGIYDIGASRGVSGILMMLLQATEFLNNNELSMIKSTIDYLLMFQKNDGSFPISLCSQNSNYIQWCQGTSGVTFLMIMAYEIFGDEKYLVSAEKSVNLIWERGLCKKSNGLCHGIAGNGYVFLRLFQATTQDIYLYRAIIFCEWVCHYDQLIDIIPDNPLSLFEGLAGQIYYISDLFKPLKAAFPGFQI